MATVDERSKSISQRIDEIATKWLTQDITEEEWTYVMYPPDPRIVVTPHVIEAIRSIGSGPLPHF